MFWKKDSVDIISVPKVTNLALAGAWSQLLSQSVCLCAQAEGAWNKTHSLGVRSNFFVQPRELSERFRHDHGK